MAANTSSRIRSSNSGVRASRFSRSNGSVFVGRAVMWQAPESIESSSKWLTSPLLQKRRGEQGCAEVAGHELPGVVDEEAAVGVAVERCAQVGALLERLGDDELPILWQQRVRRVVRKSSVGLEETADGVDRQPLEY